MDERKAKGALLTALMALWLLPLCWQLLRPGAENETEVSKPPPSLRTALSGEYQRGIEEWYASQAGLRTTLLAAWNQTGVDFFYVSHSSAVAFTRSSGPIPAKEFNSLLYPMDTAYWNPELDQFSQLYQLFREKNKHVAIAFTPSKHYLISTLFDIRIPMERNATYVKQSLDGKKISYLGKQNYIRSGKLQGWHPYSSFGNTMTTAGNCVFMDTLSDFLSQCTGKKLPQFEYTFSSAAAADPWDYALLKHFPLMYVGDIEPEAEAKITMLSDSATQIPRTLVVGDSVWLRIHESGLADSLFGEYVFLFRDQYAIVKGEKIPQSAFDLSSALEDCELLLLVSGDACATVIEDGFASRAYRTLTDPEFAVTQSGITEPEIQKMTDGIRADANWMRSIEEKAAKEGITVEEMLRRDAVYMIRQQRKK